MGCFDTVLIDCPNCGEEYEAQSKGGECTLSYYTLENCPMDVLEDVNRHAPFTCDNCKTKFKVEFKTKIIRQIETSVVEIE